jgi:hypothetical protein
VNVLDDLLARAGDPLAPAAAAPVASLATSFLPADGCASSTCSSSFCNSRFATRQREMVEKLRSGARAPRVLVQWPPTTAARVPLRVDAGGMPSWRRNPRAVGGGDASLRGLAHPHRGARHLARPRHGPTRRCRPVDGERAQRRAMGEKWYEEERLPNREVDLSCPWHHAECKHSACRLSIRPTAQKFG